MYVCMYYTYMYTLLHASIMYFNTGCIINILYEIYSFSFYKTVANVANHHLVSTPEYGLLVFQYCLTMVYFAAKVS